MESDSHVVYIPSRSYVLFILNALHHKKKASSVIKLLVINNGGLLANNRGNDGITIHFNSFCHPTPNIHNEKIINCLLLAFMIRNKIVNLGHLLVFRWIFTSWAWSCQVAEVFTLRFIKKNN